MTVKHVSCAAMARLLSISLLLTVFFGFGVVVGDAYAPISGLTSAALEKRCALLELKLDAIEARCDKLEKWAAELRVNLKARLPGSEF